MANVDREGRIYLSHPHTNNEVIFLFTTKHLILYKRLPENHEFAEIRHGDVILTPQRRHRSTCD